MFSVFSATLLILNVALATLPPSHIGPINTEGKTLDEVFEAVLDLYAPNPVYHIRQTLVASCHNQSSIIEDALGDYNDEAKYKPLVAAHKAIFSYMRERVKLTNENEEEEQKIVFVMGKLYPSSKKGKNCLHES